MKRFRVNSWLFVLALLGSLSVACEKVDDAIDRVKSVTKKIDARFGDILKIDSLELDIPADALSKDGIVSFGIFGDELEKLANTAFEISGKPITLILPVDSLYKPLQITFPLPDNNISYDNYFIFLYDGTSYLPVEYSISDENINVKIDNINWNKIDEKPGESSLIVAGFVYKQTPPPEETGLNKVTTDESGKIQYSATGAAPGSNVLLLIHGWTGRPNVWDSVITRLQNENDYYTEIWTFGYNSSYPVEQNGNALFQLLQQFANGAKIDIIAHSMGGLVSRSMIEQSGGGDYIRKLVTLGTPHKGSPLAAIRYAIGDFVSDMSGDNLLDFTLYNYFTQGFRDLDPGSEFIAQLGEISETPLPYYLIAAENNPGLWPPSSEEVLEGPDDGVVQVSSAFGLPSAVNLPDETFIMDEYKEAHRKMTRYRPVYEQAMTFLLE